jgi:hypothetical protein
LSICVSTASIWAARQRSDALAVMAGANLLLALVSWRLMAAGWRLTA